MDWFLYDNGLCHERVKRDIFCAESNKIFYFFTSDIGCYFMFVVDPF